MDGGEAAKGTEPVSAAGAGDVNISVELETKGARAENCDNDDGLLCPSPIEGWTWLGRDGTVGNKLEAGY